MYPTIMAFLFPRPIAVAYTEVISGRALLRAREMNVVGKAELLARPDLFLPKRMQPPSKEICAIDNFRQTAYNRTRSIVAHGMFLLPRAWNISDQAETTARHHAYDF
jgi:hypothetical protein